MQGVHSHSVPDNFFSSGTPPPYVEPRRQRVPPFLFFSGGSHTFVRGFPRSTCGGNLDAKGDFSINDVGPFFHLCILYSTLSTTSLLAFWRVSHFCKGVSSVNLPRKPQRSGCIDVMYGRGPNPIHIYVYLLEKVHFPLLISPYNYTYYTSFQ